MKKLIELAAGVAGGVGTTYLLLKALKLTPRLPKHLQPIEIKEEPGHYMVSVGEGLFGRTLDERVHGRLAKGLHFAYGTFWPLGLALVAERIGRRSAGRVLAAGAVMGAITWAVGYLGWLPLTGLTEPVHRQPPLRTAHSAISHVAYGLMSALPIALAEKYVEA